MLRKTRHHPKSNNLWPSCTKSCRDYYTLSKPFIAIYFKFHLTEDCVEKTRQKNRENDTESKIIASKTNLATSDFLLEYYLLSLLNCHKIDVLVLCQFSTVQLAK